MKRVFCFLMTIVMIMSVLTGCTLIEKDPYVVKFELDGGTRNGGGPLMQEVEENASPTEPVPIKNGYEFSGWDKDFSHVTSDMTVKALWIKKVTAEFDLNGGELVEGELVQPMLEGDTALAPTVTREYYVFDGWDKAIEPLSEDTVYTARWHEKTYSAEEIYDMLDESVVEITIYDIDGNAVALGSGFFIDEQGTLATNYHVIEGAYSADVMFYDGTKADVDLVKAYDVTLDLALLQIHVTSSVPIRISERPVVTGEKVYALGSSEGLTGTFSEGIVSTTSRVLDGKECIQITAPISHGNSGGPCVNEYCEVIGINSMVYNEGQNLNFAIKIHELDKLSDTMITLAELYNEMGFAETGYTSTYASVLGGEGNVSIADTGDDGMRVYDDCDFVEWEPNNTLETYDMLISGYWTAGYIDYSTDDIDVYAFSVEEKTDLFVYVLPYWVEDVDLLGAVLVSSDGIKVGELSVMQEQDVMYLGLDVYGLDAGVYFLAISLADSANYSYDVGPYYEVCADWDDSFN